MVIQGAMNDKFKNWDYFQTTRLPQYKVTPICHSKVSTARHTAPALFHQWFLNWWKGGIALKITQRSKFGLQASILFTSSTYVKSPSMQPTQYLFLLKPLIMLCSHKHRRRH